nr:hypothetical protein [Cytophagales bacterium]
MFSLNVEGSLTAFERHPKLTRLSQIRPVQRMRYNGTTDTTADITLIEARSLDQRPQKNLHETVQVFFRY